jgi:hypothetical protein
VRIDSSHPYWHIHELISRQRDVAELWFSYYKYIPQSLDDRRSIVKLTREQFLDERYALALLIGGPPGHELAIHSTVSLITGDKRHIPMIDMSTSAKAQLEKIRSYIDEGIFGNIYWFSSGRSFHGYGDSLITEADWVKLMGALLLTNQKDMKPTVDPRWIGHRLMAGYSALRWTRNSTYYITSPSELIGNLGGSVRS